MRLLFFTILYILSLTVPSDAQQRKISTSDGLNIQSKAQKLITNLVYQYNQIITSDNDERTILIRNLTSPVDNGFTPFIDDQVIIEDDFTTIGNLPKDERDKSVDAYFQNIGLYYGKSDNGDFQNQNKKVEFKNIIFSKIMLSSSKDSLYIKSYFDVKYDGIDSRTQKAFIEPCHRVAEFQAHKINGIWQVFITSLSFYNSEKETDNSKNVLIEKKEGEILVAPIQDISNNNISEKKIVCRNPILQAFKIGEGWGIKDVDSDKIVVKPTFTEIEDFSDEGLALVNQNGLWGFINTAGDLVIKCEFDIADSFGKEKKGQARVQKGTKTFFIDSVGHKTR